MNEKLTAYALNELPPDERAELEAQLQTDPALAAQAAEIKSFCHFLGEHIAPEDETLTSEQRLTLIKTFKTTPAQAVVVRPWRKLMLLSTTALAACLALMLVKNYDVVSHAAFGPTVTRMCPEFGSSSPWVYLPSGALPSVT